MVERDGLSAFGAVTRHLIRDGYRWQLRWAPWTYATGYWLFTRLAPARAIGVLALSRHGRSGVCAGSCAARRPTSSSRRTPP